MDVIYISIIVIVFTIVWNFFGVGPNDIVQILMVDIDTRINDRHDGGLPFFVFDNFIVCFIDAHAGNGIFRQV